MSGKYVRILLTSIVCGVLALGIFSLSTFTYWSYLSLQTYSELLDQEEKLEVLIERRSRIGLDQLLKMEKKEYATICAVWNKEMHAHISQEIAVSYRLNKLSLKAYELEVARIFGDPKLAQNLLRNARIYAHNVRTLTETLEKRGTRVDQKFCGTSLSESMIDV